MAEYAIKTGMTTKLVQLRHGEKVRFARKALDGAALQVTEAFMPLTVEHLDYLPPQGRIHRAEVIQDDDGESELIVYALDLEFGHAANLSVVTQPDATDDSVQLAFDVSVEPRNFDKAVWHELRDSAPVEIREHAAWSELPPIIWMVGLPVAWGAFQFSGSFLKRLGEATADGLVAWLSSATKRSKESHREALVELRFETPGGPAVLAICPLEAGSDESVANLREALDQAGAVANFAGSVAEGSQPAELRRAAFLWARHDGWQLAWWATDTHVFVTDWFRANCPDPKRFLGRPLWDLPDDAGRGDLNEPDT